MNKVERKSKVLVRIEFLDSPTHQKVLGNYLKHSGEAKSKVLAAVSAHLLPFALADDIKTTTHELECAVKNSRRELLNQISRLDDYFPISSHSDSLAAEKISNIVKSKKISSVTHENENEYEDEDDEDEDGCKVGDLNSDLGIKF